MRVFLYSPLLLAALAMAADARAPDHVEVVQRGQRAMLDLELRHAFSPHFASRLGIHRNVVARHAYQHGLALGAALDLSGTGLLFDWHPFANGFRMTTGLLYQSHRLGLTVSPHQRMQIDDKVIALGDWLRLSVRGRHDGLGRYFGIGWGATRGRKTAFSISLDLGVMTHDTMRLTTRLEGRAAEMLAARYPGEVDQAERLLAKTAQRAIDQPAYLPYFAAGITLRF